MVALTRRGLLRGLGALFVAPAIIQVGNLMPISARALGREVLLVPWMATDGGKVYPSYAGYEPVELLLRDTVSGARIERRMKAGVGAPELIRVQELTPFDRGIADKLGERLARWDRTYDDLYG